MTAPRADLVQRVRELDAKATKGPWEVTPDKHPIEINTTDGGHGYLDVCVVRPWMAHEEPNAALIVSLRNALPALADFIEAADAMRKADGSPCYEHADNACAEWCDKCQAGRDGGATVRMLSAAYDAARERLEKEMA